MNPYRTADPVPSSAAQPKSTVFDLIMQVPVGSETSCHFNDFWLDPMCVELAKPTRTPDVMDVEGRLVWVYDAPRPPWF